jgi:putative transposase
MNQVPTPAYYRHRFPSEIISHYVCLYFRFSLSFRDSEEMMAKREVAVTYESIRNWCLKFGEAYAKRMRLHSPSSGDRLHLNEVVLKIRGKPHGGGAGTMTSRAELLTLAPE